MLRKEEQRIIEEMRKLDLEIAKDNIREDNGEELPWDGNDSKGEKLETLRAGLEAELEEIHREWREPEFG
jgi:hypothetical protein